MVCAVGPSRHPAIPVQHGTFLHVMLDLQQQYRDTAATVIKGPYASLLPSSFRQAHVPASSKLRLDTDQ